MGSFLILSVVTELILLLCAVTTTQAAFTSVPTSINATLGSTATFTCSPSASTSAVLWTVNNSSLLQLNTRDVYITTSGVGDTSLHIPATEGYNNTNVRCAVVIIGESTLIFRSDPAVLRVQGLLAAVGSLEAYSGQTFILLNWTPPFSLDLTGIDPDLFYYVEIRTGGTLLTNSCTVYDPRFNFTMPSPSPCDLPAFEFVVIPVNGAGNGSMASVNGTFFRKPVCANASILVDVLSVAVMRVEIFCSQALDICNSRLVATNQKTGGASEALFPKCDGIEAVSEALSPKCEGSGLSVNVTNGTDGILFNYRYSITVELMNDDGKIDITKYLSLFDVQTATVSNSSPGAVDVSCTFAKNSRALGCLVVLHPRDTSQTEMLAYAARYNSSVPIANISIPGVPKGSHTVLVFDGEQNGLLSARAAIVQNVTVAEGGPDPRRNGISVNGTLLEVPDPAINTELQLCISFEPSHRGDDSDRIVVLAHRTDDPTNLSAYFSLDWCFRAPTAGSYYFSVFIQNSDSTLKPPVTPPEILICTVSTISPTTPSWQPQTTSEMHVPQDAGIAAGVGTAVIVLLLAIVILITVTASIAVVKSCKKKANNGPEEPYYSTVYTGKPDAIEMKENDAYGRPPPVRQEIIVEENIAYGVTGQNITRN